MKLLILNGVVAAGLAMAQTTSGPAPAGTAAAGVAVPQPAPLGPTIAMNTVVAIEIGTPLNSKDSKIGDVFPIRLAVPITDASGAVLVRAGTGGQGEVIHAARARAMGKAGEMILAARYLQCGDVRIPLGHFKFATDEAAVGKDRSKTVTALVATVGMPFMFMSGGEVTVPNGARANARITADVALTKEAAAACGAPTN